MNDIKSIEELRAYLEKLKKVMTALQRLEERTKNQRVKESTPAHKPPLFVPNATN